MSPSKVPANAQGECGEDQEAGALRTPYRNQMFPAFLSLFLFVIPVEEDRNIKDMVALFFRIVELRQQERGMFRTPVALVGLAGAFFVAGSFAPASFSMSPLAQSALPFETSMSTKGDRVAAPVPARNPTAVSIVELIGVANAAVILRDHDGKVLYKSDPRTGITFFARDTDLPVVTVKEEVQDPVAQHPARRQEGNETPQQQKPKSRNPVGCMGDVSPLAKASANRMPSLCLALLEQSLS
jgi:hypothetical protein